MAVQTVAQVMSTAPVAMPPETPLTDAARLMRDQGIGDVLVVDGGKLTGLVTDRDIAVRAIAEGRDPNRTSIAEIATPELVTVPPEESTDTVIRLMREMGVRRIPVVEGDRPVGIVTLGDLAIERDGHSALADISAMPPSS